MAVGGCMSVSISKKHVMVPYNGSCTGSMNITREAPMARMKFVLQGFEAIK